MKDFFKSVRRHIGRLDAGHLREQYALLADEASFFDTLFRTIAQGIVVLDRGGNVALSNPAARDILGMDPAEAAKSLAIPLGASSKREIEISYPDAKSVEMQTIPMEGATLVLLRDVTAEKARTEEDLAAGATKAVRELASGVAHEIGNPLNAISMNLQLLEREHRGDETVAECRRQVARLDGILKGFLQALRPSRPNLMPGSVAEPLRNCLEALKPELEDRRIAVTLDIPRALPSVAIDKAQMEQVFFNILKNALEAMKNGGTIEIALASDDNEVKVDVRDSGGGMTPEQVSHLFEPYRTSKSHGNGLGLMISARIVRDHGGTIGATSAPGEGTTFAIRLPRIEKRIRALKNG